MIDIQIDAGAVERALRHELDQLADFPTTMTEELTTWQVEDMRRRYPSTTNPDENTAQTRIWPRSRLTEQRHMQDRQAKRLLRYPARTRRHRGTGPRPHGPVAHSMHPILRPELFDQLVERMDQLMVDELSWA